MSKMYVILVIVLARTIVKADDSSDETKYIDLLPEKEKADFLERIARRIFNGVQSKDDRDAVSGEVTDVELEEQDKFVKDILEEESLNLRKRGDVDIDDKIEDIVTKHKSDEENHVKNEASNKKDIADAADGSSLVDLTFRDGKRNKRNSFQKTNEDSKIIHVSIGNGEIDVPDEKNDHSNGLTTQDQDVFDVEDIQIKSSKQNLRVDMNEKSTKNSPEDFVKKYSEKIGTTSENSIGISLKEIQSQETIEKKSNEKIRDNYNIENIENNKFALTKKIVESLENEDNKRESQKEHIVPEASLITATSEFTTPEIKTPVKITEKLSIVNDSSKGPKNASPNARVLRTYDVGLGLMKNKDPEVLDISKYNTEDNAKEKNSTLVTGAPVLNMGTQTNLNDGSEAGNNLENVSSVVIIKEKTLPLSVTSNEQITEKMYETTTLNTEVLTKASLRTGEETTVEEESKKEPMSNLKQLKKTDSTKEIYSKELIGGELFKNMIKKGKQDKAHEVNNKNYEEGPQEKLDNITNNYANNMIKVLRTEIIPAFNSDEKNFNGLRDLYEATKSNGYSVYSVPAGKQPFKQKNQQDTGNKDNQYYVPVYNYFPENAYYNPRNRLGPNADDDDENIINVNVEDDLNDDLDANKHKDIDLNENDRDNLRDRLRVSKNTAGSDELFRDENKDRYNFEDFIRRINYKKTRKFRFGKTKKNHDEYKPYKVNLPVVVQYPKFTDIILSSNDYSDVDYYYGRPLKKPSIRNRCEIDKNDDVFPATTEHHPYNNMNDEENLKDHIRSVRMLLYKQKKFGYIPERNTTESVESLEEALRSRQTKDSMYNDKNIAMDYFFGRMNDGEHTPRVKNIDSTYHKRNKYNDEYRNINMANNRYIDGFKNENNNPYKNEQTVFKNRLYQNNKKHDLIRDLYKAQSYINNDIKPATPAYHLPNYYYKNPLRAKTKKTKTIDYEKIREILSMTDANDLLPTLEKLRKLNTTRKTDGGINLEPYVEVLGDMVKNNAKALRQYDWLQTTVDIQAALVKLMDMTDELRHNIAISPPDLQLLKYTIYLHRSAKTLQVKDFRKNKFLPRNKKKKKGIITESGLLNRHWLIRMLDTNHEKDVTKEDLNDFNEFLNDLQYYLYDLHTAVQQIADITKFNTQKWFQNLKELYLDTKEKRLLEVLLHLTTTRLLDLIEESAKIDVEDDYLTFVMKNEKYVERAKEEFGVVLKIIEKLKLK